MSRLKFSLFFIAIFILNSFHCYQVRVNEIKTADDTDQNEDQTNARVAILSCSLTTANDGTAIRLPNVFYKLKQNKWSASVRPNCIQNQTDVYKLCKRIYPSQDVENIIESNHLFEYEFYTDGDSQQLIGKQIARPYVCLFGTYKASLTNVPIKNCDYKQVYDENKCETKAYWLQYAREKCEETPGQFVNHTSIAQWCDSNSINKFMGVQYVCCAKEQVQATTQQAAVQPNGRPSVKYSDEDGDDEDDDDLYDNYDIDDDENKDSNEVVTEKFDQQNLPKIPLGKQQQSSEELEDDDLEAIDGDLDEKSRYSGESKNISDNYEVKTRALISEWHRQRDLNKNNEQRLHDIDQEYNGKVQALNEEKQRLNVKMELIHSDIIQRFLNEKKLNAKNALDAFKPNPSMLGNTEMFRNLIKSFLKAYEQDRLHQLTLFKRLNTFDLIRDEEFSRRKEQIIEQLKVIEQTVQTKLDEIRQTSQFKTKIEATLNKLLARYASIKADAKYLIEQFEVKGGERVVLTNNDSIELDDIDSIEDDDDDYLNNKVVPGQTTTPVAAGGAAPKATTQTSVNSVESNELFDDYEEDDDIDDDIEDEDDVDGHDSDEYNDSTVSKENDQNSIENNESAIDDYEDEESVEDDVDDVDDTEDDDGDDDDDSSSIENLVENENGEPQLNSGSLNRFNSDQYLHEASMSSKINNHKRSDSILVYGLVSLCVVVLMAFTVIGYVVRRRQLKANGFYANSYRPLDQEQGKVGSIDDKLLNREERYVNHMQVHGFVNPMHAVADGQTQSV